MRFLRKPEVLARFGVGSSKFEDDIRPLLREGEVALGPRVVTWTDTIVDKVQAAMLAARDAAGPEAALQAKIARTPVEALKAKKAAQKPPPAGERKPTTSAKPTAGERNPSAQADTATPMTRRAAKRGR